MVESYRTFEDDSVTPVLGAPFFEEHLARYWFLQKYGDQKNILELGCGSGYGARVLAEKARNVLACDLNEKSIQFARKHYAAANIEFRQVDVTSEFPKSAFDLVVSLEVIEHLYPAQVQTYLETAKRAMKPTGQFILSTPNHQVVQKSGVYVPEFHINNLGSQQLRVLLNQHFRDVEIIGQAFPMGRLKKVIYFLDRWSWRHSGLFKIFRQNFSAKPIPPVKCQTGVPWQPSQGYGRANHYLFSKHLANQAGMIMAICSRPIL